MSDRNYNIKDKNRGIKMDLKDKIEKLALRSMKPSRYIGGEVGSVVKDK